MASTNTISPAIVAHASKDACYINKSIQSVYLHIR